MIDKPKPKPKILVPPKQTPPVNESNESDDFFKPYKLVTFPTAEPPKGRPAGHDRYLKDRLHGTLFLTLKVQTPLHVSTGIVAMGSDIGSRVPLIKTMTLDTEKKLVIQGSSFKGCIRSVYEAVTNSTLGVITSKYKDKIPAERLPCKKKDELCAASQVFGALDWQGLIEFSDAKCESANYGTGFMPSLYAPRPQKQEYYNSIGKAVGRKFYYNFAHSIDRGQNQGIAVQQASKDFVFTTKIQFKNLKPEELGTLLVVLGQDINYPIALKIGGGKPVGMGTMTVSVTKIEQAGDLHDRYLSYTPPEADQLTEIKLQEFIQKQIKVAHDSSLIQKDQLEQLAEILRYPSDMEPPLRYYKVAPIAELETPLQEKSSIPDLSTGQKEKRVKKIIMIQI